MKMRVKKLSFDGEHWWEPQDPEWIVEVDETKIKGGTGKPDESRENSDPVCEKNYPLPLNVPNVPYIP